MSELSDFLVKSILNEETERAVALFGGGFKPPTKGHLEVINQGIKNNPEVSEVKILVGAKKRNGFTQSQAVKIWNLYNDIGFIGKPATIIPVSSPFTYYKEYLKEHPEDKVYVFIGSREGDDKDQMDVKQRSEFVKKYSNNVIPVEVSTGGGVSGTEARKLFKTDVDSFRNMFPENLIDQDWKRILDILNNKKEKSNKVTSNKTEPLKPINEDTIEKTDLVLPRGKKIYLQAEEEDYNRGLIVELTEEGGYKMNYWYGDDAKVYPVEVEVDGESIKPDANEVYMKFHPELEKEPINENATYSSKIDYKQQIKDLTKYMLKKGMNIKPLPKVIFKNGDQENASQFLGKTAYYDPNDMVVVLYTEGRHPKDIVRSFAHEMIHHVQNLEDRLENISTTNTMEDDNLNDIEREAYTKGNMTFRNWTDNKDGEEVTSLNEKKKDPFGLNQFARELVKETFNKTVTIDMDIVNQALKDGIFVNKETDENIIAVIEASPQGKVPHPVFLDFYKKYDKYFGEKSDERILDEFGLKQILTTLLNLSDEDVQIVMNHYKIEDKKLDDDQWYERHDNEEGKEEEHNIPGFDDTNDNYEDVINYRKKQLSKSLEEQKKVRIFNPNCNCDKT